MGGYTIAVAPNAGPEDLQTAIDMGPAAVATESPYPDLFENAGFEILLIEDVSEEFARIAEARVAGWEEYWSELTDDLEGWADDLERVRRARSAADSGTLVRYLIVARKR